MNTMKSAHKDDLKRISLNFDEKMKEMKQQEVNIYNFKFKKINQQVNKKKK
jgi:hypothetical protein